MRIKKKDLLKKIESLEARNTLLYKSLLSAFGYEVKMCRGFTRDHYGILIRKLKYSEEFQGVRIDDVKILYEIGL